jgi:hypothetical protein
VQSMVEWKDCRRSMAYLQRLLGIGMRQDMKLLDAIAGPQTP